MALCDALPWIFVPSCNVSTAPSPLQARDPQHLHAHVLARLQRQRANIAAGAKVRAFPPDKSDACQVALARQRALPTRKHPHAVGIQQQAHHHGGIKRRRAPGFFLIAPRNGAHPAIRLRKMTKSLSGSLASGL